MTSKCRFSAVCIGKNKKFLILLLYINIDKNKIKVVKKILTILIEIKNKNMNDQYEGGNYGGLSLWIFWNTTRTCWK